MIAKIKYYSCLCLFPPDLSYEVGNYRSLFLDKVACDQTMS